MLPGEWARKDAFIPRIEKALTLDCPYFHGDLTIQSDHPVPAAVLVLFGWSTALASDDLNPKLLLIKRTDTVETHKGQMAFPGGVIESTDRSAIDAALRESFEEVGIPAESVDVLGVLPDMVTITNYLITPVVGVMKYSVDGVPLELNPDEIAEALWVPYAQFSSPGVYRKELWRHEEKAITIHAYQIGPHNVWGITGALIRNLLDRIGGVDK